MVINSSFARTYFPTSRRYGQHLQVGAIPNPDPRVPWMEIVGIVADVKQSLASESSTEMYVPFHQADQVLPVLTLSWLCAL